MENVKNSLKLFVEYLQIEKNYSQYTIVNYVSDIEDFFVFMQEQSLTDLRLITYSDTRLYLTQLHQKNFARKTISRKISSLRSFYRFLNREKLTDENPFSSVSLPKKSTGCRNICLKKSLSFSLNIQIFQLLQAKEIRRFSKCSTERAYG